MSSHFPLCAMYVTSCRSPGSTFPISFYNLQYFLKRSISNFSDEVSILGYKNLSVISIGDIKLINDITRYFFLFCASWLAWWLSAFKNSWTIVIIQDSLKIFIHILFYFSQKLCTYMIFMKISRSWRKLIKN